MITNPSFEVAGTGIGEALGWTWTHVTANPPWIAEGFEVGWGTDPLIDALIDPAHDPANANTEVDVFAEGSGSPEPAESFEARWLLPVTPPPSDLGNALSLFAWEAGQTAFFATVLTAEAFEQGWSGNERSLFAFDLPIAQLAAHATESFEGAWANDGFLWSLPAGHFTAANFTEGVAFSGSDWHFVLQTSENFESVFADQPMTFTGGSAVIHVPNPNFYNQPMHFTGMLQLDVTVYNAGGAGALPPELDSRSTYLLTMNPDITNTSAVSIGLSLTGSPIVCSEATGNNFVKTDPRGFWTLTDVGI